MYMKILTHILHDFLICHILFIHWVFLCEGKYNWSVKRFVKKNIILSFNVKLGSFYNHIVTIQIFKSKSTTLVLDCFRHHIHNISTYDVKMLVKTLDLVPKLLSFYVLMYLTVVVLSLNCACLVQNFKFDKQYTKIVSKWSKFVWNDFLKICVYITMMSSKAMIKNHKTCIFILTCCKRSLEE